jgi:hypothetical protein
LTWHRPGGEGPPHRCRRPLRQVAAGAKWVTTHFAASLITITVPGVPLLAAALALPPGREEDGRPSRSSSLRREAVLFFRALVRRRSRNRGSSRDPRQSSATAVSMRICPVRWVAWLALLPMTVHGAGGRSAEPPPAPPPPPTHGSPGRWRSGSLARRLRRSQLVLHCPSHRCLMKDHDEQAAA